MDEIILSELTNIKYLLWIILFLLVVIIVYSFSRTFIGNLSQLSIIKKNQFISMAQSYEDKGENVELKELAQKRLNSHPKDVSAWWYLAIAQYKLGELGGALSSFSELRTIDPTWSSEAVVEYIDEIRTSMGGPDRKA